MAAAKEGELILPALPWEAPRPQPASASDFSSPGDYVAQVLNFQFQVNATRIIFGETLTKVRFEMETHFKVALL